MAAHSLSESAAYFQAMHELHQQYDGPIPGGNETIRRRARWYMLTKAEQWRTYARVHAGDLRLARQRGWPDREADALARCRHAVAQWRIERKPAQSMAAE